MAGWLGLACPHLQVLTRGEQVQLSSIFRKLNQTDLIGLGFRFQLSN